MVRKNRYWIQKAVKRKGALSRQLGIPVEDDIPDTLLLKIKKTPVGKVICNPTKKGKRRIRVTRLLKKRAVLAYTLKHLKRKRRKK